MTEEIKRELSPLPVNWVECKMEVNVDDKPEVKMEVKTEIKTEPIDKCPTDDDVTIMKPEVTEDLEENWVEVEFVLFSEDEATTKRKKDLAAKGPRNGIKKKRHTCSYCDYTANLKRDIVKHNYTHTKEKPFKCSICEFATVYRDVLKTHILLKHGDMDKKFKCELCGYCTYRKGLLKEHMQSHSLENPFKCDSCNFSTKRKLYLNKHLLLRHTEKAKQHKCETCGYTTALPYRLKRHLRVHSTDKQYKCMYKACACTNPCECAPCKFASVRRDSLKKHVLARHAGEKTRYNCERCDYSSYTKKGLTAHAQQHAECN